MLAVVLALASSLAYGVSDFFGGRVSRAAPLLSVLIVSQVSAFALLALIVGLGGEGLPAGRFLLYAALAGVSEAVAVAALYRGFAVGVISLVAPVAATAPMIPVLASLALGQVPSRLQAVGVVLAVVGIVLSSRERPSAERAARSKTVSSLVFGLLAALGFGSFYVAMDAASTSSVPWALFTARLTSLSLFVLALLLSQARVTMPRHLLPIVAATGVLIVAADTLYATASTLGLLSVVAVLSSLHAVVTIALARIVLGEQLSGPQRVGVVLCLSGVVAIASG